MQKPTGPDIPLLAGVCGLVVTGLFTTFFGPHSVSRIEARVQAAAETALAGMDVSYIEPEANGQRVSLQGVAPSDAARQGAVDAVRTALGSGGLLAGGVTKVTSAGLVVAPEVSPYVWRAEKSGTGVVLSGVAPTPQSLDAIHAAAGVLFPGAVESSMRLASGAPDGVNWEVAAMQGLEALRALESGEAALSGDQLVVSGVAPDDATANRIREKLVLAGGGVATETRITGPSGALPAARSDDPPMPLQDAEAIKEACEAAFAGVIDSSPVLFGSANATITRSSLVALERIATVALSCEGAVIEIAGFTDNSGSRQFNTSLSRRRAEAVRAWLIDNGVPADRLIAQGYGSAEPKASNRNSRGRAQNRRIEFRVTGVESP
jgi:OOP family OmpA-OmpF porin